jgi:hypothetical protein
MVRVKAATIRLGASEARRKEGAQRYDRQTDSYDGQYKLGIIISTHFTTPPISILAVIIRPTLDSRDFGRCSGLFVIKTPEPVWPKMMVWTPARFSYGLTMLVGPTMTRSIISQGRA